MDIAEIIAYVIVIGMYLGIIFSAIIVFIYLPIKMIKESKERHHNKPMKQCKNCEYNRERVYRSYHGYLHEKYCSKEKCIKEDK